MSRQKIGAAEREALWSAHGRKCAYTRKLLDVSNFHVDHIIPERLLDHPDELERVKSQLGLSNVFDIRGFETLLPCEPGSNLQKGDATLDHAHAHFFLNLASSKRESVEKNLESIKTRQNRGRALILLQQCIDSGELTREDVSSILDQHGDVPESIFGLLQGMSFGGQVPVKEIAKEEIEDLRDRPLVFGNNSHISRLELRNPDNEKISVGTCREYDNAISAGYTPLSNFEIKMAVFCEHQCGLLNVLSYATQPLSSFIDRPE